ncbi:MAG: SDR family oxidoreductase [Ignavibacteriaceae bacterium]
MQKELLIFGANSSLGKGVIKALAGKDFDKIYLFARNFSGMEIPGNAEKIEIKDLSIEENVRNCFNLVVPSKEKLFFLFSSIGGFTGGKKVWETGKDDLDRMLGINLIPGFFLAKYFSLLVSGSAGGSICFTAAFTGKNPEPGKSVYGLSKAALIHLVETLALEGKNINLTANAIAPYIIDTPENRKWMEESDLEKSLKPIEIGELVYDIFRSFYFITGNIIELTERQKINGFMQG